MYVCRYVGLSTENPYKKYICLNAWAELRGPNMAFSKSVLGG